MVLSHSRNPHLFLRFLHLIIYRQVAEAVSSALKTRGQGIVALVSEIVSAISGFNSLSISILGRHL